MMAINRKALTENRWIISDCLSGLVIAFTVITYVISLACLVFSGNLRQYLAYGTTTALAATLVLTLIQHFRGCARQSIFLIQDVPSVVLAVTIAKISLELQKLNVSHSPFSTIVATIACYTAIAGVFFFISGKLRLGEIVRYFPFTVSAGFLAGLGLLTINRATVMLVEQPLDVAFWLDLSWRPEVFIRWAPCLLFGFIVFFSQRKASNPFGLPILLLLGTFAFFGVLFALGISHEQAKEMGFLLEAEGVGNYVALLEKEFSFSYIHWPLIINNLANVSGVILLGIISMILNASTYETLFRQPYFLSEEFKGVGIGNCVTSLFGGIAGYSTIMSINLNYILKTKTRLPAIICMVSCLIVLLFSDHIISWLPVPIISGFAVYIGLYLVDDWLINKRKQMSWLEYLLVIVIAVAIAFWSLIYGLFIGFAGVAIIFVIEYSRIHVVRQELDGSVYRSHIKRTEKEIQAINKHAAELYILRLQGFIFFGTATKVLDTLRKRLREEAKPFSVVVLDFQFVDKVDFSALINFNKILHMAESQHFYLVYTGLTETMHQQFRDNQCFESSQNLVKTFADLDSGAEFFESYALEKEQVKVAKHIPITQTLKEIFSEESGIEIFSSLLEKREYGKGAEIFSLGDIGEGMYFIESGAVQISFEKKGEENKKLKHLRLTTLGPGTYFGEMTLFTKMPRTAGAKALEPTILYYLSEEAVEKLQTRHPKVFMDFQSNLIAILSQRLNTVNKQRFYLIQTNLG